MDAIPQPYLNIPGESRYLLKLNLTTTALAFFRSLHPELASHFCVAQPNSDVSSLPKTARLQQRPASGTTPKIGMKIPALLPNLNSVEKNAVKKNEVAMVIDRDDALLVMQMQAQCLKESLL